MSGHIHIEKAGPGLSVQDLGRPGHLATGLARGGAADRLALFEAAALLGLPKVAGAIEMAGVGGRFVFTTPSRIALTGAEMVATLDGAAVGWNVSLLVLPGQVLEIGGARAGVFGYLTPAGGVLDGAFLGSVSSNLVAGIGRALVAGDSILMSADPKLDDVARIIKVADRFSGGVIRFMPGPQTELFSPETIERFQATAFTRSPAGNRQGVRMDHDGAAFAAEVTGLASDLILPGDIQMTGDGVPYVLLADCQTTGGYARIGTVIEADQPMVAQAGPGASLTFALLSLAEADAIWRPEAGLIAGLKASVKPLVRSPHDMGDLLSYQLISGVVSGNED